MDLTETAAVVYRSIVALGSLAVPARLRFGPNEGILNIIGTGFVVDPRGIVMTAGHVARALSSLPRHPETGRHAAMAILFGEPTRVGDALTAMKTSASSRSAARVPTKKRNTSQARALRAARLDEMHDAGEDLTAHLDLAGARRPVREIQRVNVDFPVDLLHAIDREAKRIGVSRQAFIKLRLAETLTSSR